MRSASGGIALGNGQTHPHPGVHAISGALGAETVLARDGSGVPHQLGQGLPCRRVCYQIESSCTRLLWVGKERTTESFQQFFTVIGAQLASQIEFVCSDMWPPYLQLIRQHCTRALNILDRFHIVAKMNKALDEVRAGEARQLVRAGKFLDTWCTQTLRSRIGPMKKVALTLRTHRDLLLNYFRARKAFSSGVIEGLNDKAKVTMRKSYGFRTFRITELSLYHALGKLPEPTLAHSFTDEPKRKAVL